MKSKVITVVPVYNGAEYIAQTLQSVAAQTLRPDRVIVQDNCSTDNTEEVVRNFKGLPIEWRQNGKNLLSWANFNRGLEFADQTEYLHLLCADDAIKPEFYARLSRELESCPGIAMAYCLDERIDENNKTLSISGKITGVSEIQDKAVFLREKAELSNQAFSASLLKTIGQPAPCRFTEEYHIMGDSVFWATWGSHCERIVRVHEALCLYRWHGTNGSGITDYGANLKALVLDEWEVMQRLEKLRGASADPVRQFKLKGIFAVRSGIKVKRFRQLKNYEYAHMILQTSRKISGPLAWYMAQAIVQAREVAVYNIAGRGRHPKNVYG